MSACARPIGRGNASGGGWLALVAMLAGALCLALVLVYPPSPELVAGGHLRGTQVVGDDFPKRLIDPLGRSLVLTEPPRRIASAVLAGDEMLAGLVAIERLVGVTYLADDPGISNVAGRYPGSIARTTAEVEALLALRPDLVVVATHSDAVAVRMLLQAGVAVVRLPSVAGFAEIETSLLTLGGILGRPEEARVLAMRMRQRLAAVDRRVAGRARPRVLWYDVGGSSAGRGTLTDEMIERAGGHNVIRDTGIRGHRRITPELAIALQPQVVIMADWAGSAGVSPAESLMREPAWQLVPAVRERRVHALRGAWVTAESQFRVAGVEAVARLLHPGAFAPVDG